MRSIMVLKKSNFLFIDSEKKYFDLWEIADLHGGLEALRDPFLDFRDSFYC